MNGSDQNFVESNQDLSYTYNKRHAIVHALALKTCMKHDRMQSCMQDTRKPKYWSFIKLVARRSLFAYEGDKIKIKGLQFVQSVTEVENIWHAKARPTYQQLKKAQCLSRIMTGFYTIECGGNIWHAKARLTYQQLKKAQCLSRIMTGFYTVECGGRP